MKIKKTFDKNILKTLTNSSIYNKINFVKKLNKSEAFKLWDTQLLKKLLKTICFPEI